MNDMLKPFRALQRYGGPPPLALLALLPTNDDRGEDSHSAADLQSLGKGLLWHVLAYLSARDLCCARFICTSTFYASRRMPLNIVVQQDETSTFCVSMLDQKSLLVTGLRVLSIRLDDHTCGKFARVILGDCLHRLQALKVQLESKDGRSIDVTLRSLVKANFSKLKTLDLSDNLLSDSSFDLVVTALESTAFPQLKNIMLARNLLSDRACSLLAAVLARKYSGTLRYLDLSSNKANEAFLTLVKAASFLRRLNLTDNDVAFSTIVKSANLLRRGSMQRFRSIELSGNPIGESLFRLLVQSPSSVPNLEVVSVRGTLLNDTSAELIARLISLGVLRNVWNLDLSDNKITCVGIGLITDALSSGKCAMLRSLAVACNDLGDAGIGHIALCIETRSLASLSSLDISFNKGSVLSIARLSLLLADSSCCPCLQDLHIAGNLPTHLSAPQIFRRPHYRLHH